MLTIDKDDQVVLPKDYHEIHNICAVIYDQILGIGKDDFFENFNVTKFEGDIILYESIKKIERDELSTKDFLRENNLDAALVEFITKDLTNAILSDLCSFTYESLNAAKKGKMSVAFALIRKPLTDELLILEQILLDKEDFVYRFFHEGDPKAYDPSGKGIDKELIIRKVLELVKVPLVFTEDVVIKLRYDKSNPNGVNSISNRALHIVTMDSKYKTNNKSLNFVFSLQSDIDKYWSIYYKVIPSLLIYTAAVVDEIAFSYVKNRVNYKELRAFIRELSLMIIFESEISKKILEEVCVGLSSVCWKCGKDILVEKADLTLLVHNSLILCPYCFENQIFSTEMSYKMLDLLNQLQKKII